LRVRTYPTTTVLTVATRSSNGNDGSKATSPTDRPALTATMFTPTGEAE
jgi:hypothetical protein